ncbi:MAG: hypothetical protein KC503_15730 [Myxococcales bacterium]|nr:hypothetical protein [Myxococcales bacterium]
MTVFVRMTVIVQMGVVVRAAVAWPGVTVLVAIVVKARMLDEARRAIWAMSVVAAVMRKMHRRQQHEGEAPSDQTSLAREPASFAM